MNHRQSFSTIRNLLLCSLAAFFLGGCGGDHLDPVLGTPGQVVTLPTPVTPPPVVPDVPVVPADTARPTVVRTIPGPGETNVSINRLITAVFNEDMNPTTISGTSFRVTNATSNAPVAGSVSYSAASRTATFTPSAVLPNATQFNAIITRAATDVAGNGLAGSAAAPQTAGDHTWSFTTGLAPDNTRPTVSETVPEDDATGVPVSQGVTAQFSENMSPGTIPENFAVTIKDSGVAVPGTVVYATGSRTATFTPASPLPFSTSFTAAIKPAATDLAGNLLVGNAAPMPDAGSYTWDFTTAAEPDNVAPTPVSFYPTSPAQCEARSVIVSFSEAMNVSSINKDTFLVTVNGVAVGGNIEYDAVNNWAEIITGAVFPTGSTVGFTVKSGTSGVKDVAGNPLAEDYEGSFTAGSASCRTGVDLGAAFSFGGFGGNAGMTNSGVKTVISGDIGTTAACTLMVGFHDSTTVYTETKGELEGLVNGAVFCPAAVEKARQAAEDAAAAYRALELKPSEIIADQELGGKTLPPGVYKAAAGVFDIFSDLTLDGEGDPNAVWIFQTGIAALNVGKAGGPIVAVNLINGADAANVYWQVGSAARIEDGSTMVGTIIAQAGVTISTAGTPPITTLNGRAIGLNASVTMVDTVINVPPAPLD